ncbi:MAG: hypothetical protein M3R27_08155 [Bacteroidota bacterium]|nr:hypothetical protein [Bacteroidota bacterium]
MASVFLLSSLGLTVNKMICLESGNQKVSLTPLQDCCPENENDLASVESDCCDIQNSSFHLNDFQPSQEFSNQTFAKALPVSFVYNTPDTDIHKEILSYTDLPPPLHGRALLRFISVLTI